MESTMRTVSARNLGIAIKAIQAGAASAPLVLLVLLVSLATHIRLGLGHWPQPMIEDLHTAAFQWHDKVVGIGFIFSFYLAAPVWLLGQFVLLLRGQGQNVRTHAVLFVGGWCVIMMLAALDPT